MGGRREREVGEREGIEGEGERREIEVRDRGGRYEWKGGRDGGEVGERER